MFKSFCDSFLQYGIIAWGFYYDIHVKPIYTLQRNVVRAIAFMNLTSPYFPIFCDSKALKLYNLVNMKLLLFFYESVDRISSFVSTIFEILSDVHQHDTS